MIKYYFQNISDLSGDQFVYESFRSYVLRKFQACNLNYFFFRTAIPVISHSESMESLHYSSLKINVNEVESFDSNDEIIQKLD